MSERGILKFYVMIIPAKTRLNALTNLKACLANIGAWMDANMFILNQKKTELIIFEPKYQLAVNDEIPLQDR